MKKSIKNNSLLRLTCLILVLILCAGLFAGCDKDLDTGKDEQTEKDGQTEQPVQEEPRTADEENFDKLMDEIFEDWVTTDALSMNYYLADPESRGIERPEATFGEIVSPKLIEEAREETQKLSERLKEFKYETLRDDQKIVYDILSRSIKIYEIMEREDDFFYFTGIVRPLNGLQVMFPTLMAEFNFYTAEDIIRYLDLLEDTGRYFDDIIEYERERSRRGFFLSAANVDSVTEQIESYLENREDNLLILVFNDRIDEYEGLSAGQRESYKERNKELVLNNVLPAYDKLLSAMKELRGKGEQPGGLAELPGGRDYAYALLRNRTGSDRSPEEWLDILGEELNNVWMEIVDALHGESQLIDKYIAEELGEIPDSTPKTYVSILQKKIAEDFPPIRPTQLTILEVHESLQEHMSPAFYLMPAVDRYDENVVYVNPSSISDNLFMFTALAHESYPGHMYQTVYFLQQSPHPVRKALTNLGHTEGWATYAEMKSYFYTELDTAEAELMWNFRLFDYLLIAYVDLGVNVMGWNLAYITEIFREFGFDMDSLFDRVTGTPVMPAVYAMGYIELTGLLKDAQRAMGSDFDLMDFHRYILEFGAAPYPMIRTSMLAYIESQKEALTPAA